MTETTNRACLDMSERLAALNPGRGLSWGGAELQQTQGDLTC